MFDSGMQMPLLWALICACGLGMACSAIAIKRPNFHLLVVAAAVVSIFLSLYLLIIRGLLAYALPLSNGVDFGLWFTFFLLICLIFLVLRHHLYAAGLLINVCAAVLCRWMLAISLEVNPLPPALRSSWLMFHVSVAVLAYVVLCVSFVLSILLIYKVGHSETTLVTMSADDLDQWSYRMVLLGVPLLTVMLITGSVWAEVAWGSYWSWDPKETWGLITWLVYALYLHLRLSGWKHKKAAYLNILGFMVVLFTFFGVSYLLPGLHSYL